MYSAYYTLFCRAGTIKAFPTVFTAASPIRVTGVPEVIREIVGFCVRKEVLNKAAGR